MKELSGVPQKRTGPGRVRPPQLAASFPTRSGAATHRSEASHPPSVSFLFWRGSSSGCTLFLSPHGIVAVIGDGNAGRAPANPRTDGAAHARASPFHTNRTFRETTYGGSSTSAQGSPRHSAGRRARPPCSQSPPSRDSFSHDRVAGCALRLIATIRYDGLRPPATIDRDHPFRAIATSLWTGVMEAVG
jgi:hypothetical protein